MPYKDHKLYLASQLRYNQKHREERRQLAIQWRKKKKSTLEGYGKILYQSIGWRLKYCKSYKDRKIHFTLEQFLKYLNKNKVYKKLHNEWVNSNFDKKLSPSVDRIDNKKDYTLINVQILTHYNNSLKWNKKDRFL